MNVVVVGSLNMDVLIPVYPYPAPGETVMGGQIKYIPGGKGANQALAAARQGADVTMLGMVGTDGHGETLKKTLEAGLVRTSFIEAHEGSSGMAFVHLEPDGSNRIILAPGANMAFTPDQALKYRHLIENADAVMLQLEIPLDTVKTVLDIAMSAGVPTFLDPAPATSDLFRTMGRLDWVTPNEHEAELLTGLKVQDAKTARIAAAKLQQMGAKKVILKVGAQGAYVADENGISFHSGFPISAVDTTAAGDAFSGAFVVEFLKHQNVSTSLRMACAAGALAATKEGAQTSLPLRREVLAFLDEVDSALTSLSAVDRLEETV